MPSRRCSLPTRSAPIARASWRPRRTAIRAGAVTRTVRIGAGAAFGAGAAPRWRFWAAWRVMLRASAIELHDEPATRAHDTASRSRRSSSPRRTVIARSASSGSSVLTARRRSSPSWRSPVATPGVYPPAPASTPVARALSGASAEKRPATRRVIRRSARRRSGGSRAQFQRSAPGSHWAPVSADLQTDGRWSIRLRPPVVDSGSYCPLPTGGPAALQPEPAHLDRRAAVHDHVEPGCPRALGGVLVDHAELHPHGTGADGDRLVDVRAGGVGAAEDVDDVDRSLAELGDARDAALAEDLRPGGVRVHRHDPVAAAAKEVGDAMAVAVRARRAADDRPREPRRQQRADGVVERGGGHPREDRSARAGPAAPRYAVGSPVIRRSLRDGMGST